MNVNSVMYSGKLDKPKANTYENSDSKEEYEKYIVDSWQRCRNYGLTPYGKIEIRKLSGKELDSLLDENHHFIHISSSYMENIYSLVKGTGFVIFIADEKWGIHQ